MDDDEFLKELQEATKIIEQENQSKEQSSNNKVNNSKNTNNNTSNSTFNNNNNAPFNEADLNNNLNKLLSMFGNLSPEKMGFDEKDKDEFKKFHDAFMNELKNEGLFNELNNMNKNNIPLNDGGTTINNTNTNTTFSNIPILPNISTTDNKPNTNNNITTNIPNDSYLKPEKLETKNNSNTSKITSECNNNKFPINCNNNISNISNNKSNKSSDNPFTDIFNQMNSDVGNVDMNMFGEEFGKIFESLNKLSDFTEKDGGLDGKDKEAFPNFLEGALESLISAKLLDGPLKEIQKELIKFKEEKKNTISEEKLKEYDSMLQNIDCIIKELNNTNPNKAKIIECFSKLQEVSELDKELFDRISPDMGMLGGFGDLCGKTHENKTDKNDNKEETKTKENSEKK